MSKDTNSPEKVVLEDDNFTPPSVTVTDLTFSSGSTVRLQPDDIIVFVGPNNAGKSASLREIQSSFSRTSEPRNVITDVQTQKTGTKDDLVAAIKLNSHESYTSGNLYYTGSGYQIHSTHLDQAWNGRLDLVRDFFLQEAEDGDQNHRQRPFSVLLGA